MKSAQFCVLFSFLFATVQFTKSDPTVSLPQFHSQFLPVKEKENQEGLDLQPPFRTQYLQVDHDQIQRNIKISSQDNKPELDAANFLSVKKSQGQDNPKLKSKFQMFNFQADQNPTQNKPDLDAAKFLSAKQSQIQQNPSLSSEFQAQHFEIDQNPVQRNLEVSNQHNQPDIDAAKKFSAKQLQSRKRNQN